MSGWVTVTGPPRAIWRRKSGITLPEDPSTFPKRTQMKRVPLDSRAQDVVPHGLERVPLHERNVLVGGCVEDDGRPVPLEELAHLGLVRHVGEHRDRVVEVPLVRELPLDVHERVLGMVHEHDPVGAEGGALPAELRSDRTPRARDQDGGAREIGSDRREVELDRLPPEHVLHLHLAELWREVEVARDELVYARKGLHRHARVAARVHDPLPNLAAGGGYGDDDLVRLVVAQEVREIAGRPEHADAVKAHVPLALVVVHEPHRRVAEAGALLHLLDDELAGVARADDERFLPASDDPAPARALDDRAGEHARSHDEGQEDEPVEDDDRARDAQALDGVEQIDDDLCQEGCHGDGAGDGPHVPDGEVPPPVVVEPEEDEHADLDRDHDHDGLLEEALVTGGDPVVEAKSERQVPGGPDQRRVHRDLPDPVPVQGPHVALLTDTVERTVSTTRSCCSALIPAHSGSAIVSRPARSVSGRSPSSQPSRAKTGWRWRGVREYVANPMPACFSASAIRSRSGERTT